ncbi:MAG: choice-of-anchor J domain-containing protein [Hyphomicrobiales bacterium]
MEKKLLLLLCLITSFYITKGQAIFQEGFNGDKCPPEGWSVTYSSENPPDYNRLTSDGLTKCEGTKSIKFSSYMTESNGKYDTYLVTPELTVPSEGHQLLFSYSAGYSSDEKFKVGISTSGKDLDNDFTWSEEIVANGSSWMQYIENNIPATTKYICIHHYADNKMFFYVDDFQILAPKGQEIKSVTHELPLSSEVRLIGGNENHPIFRIKFNVDGTGSPLQINKIKLNTEGTTNVANIKNAKLYYTGNGTDFDKSYLLNTIDTPSGDFEFEIEKELISGDNYFWVTYDISEDAKDGNFIDAKLISYTVGDNTVEIENGVTEGNRKIRTPLNGTYSVGTGEDCDFEDFSDATVNLMEYGVSAPVIFEVEAGTYVDRMTIPSIRGISKDNIVTFKSKSGNNDDVIFKGDANSILNYTIHLDGAAFITFENLTITYNNEEYARLISSDGGSNNITFKNNIFKGVKVFEADLKQNRALVYCDNALGKDVEDDFKFIDNTFLNGSVGLKLTGIDPLEKFEKGLLIEGNTFTDQYYKAIFASCQDGFVIKNNTIFASNTGVSYDAIHILACGGNGIIEGNKIDVTTTGCQSYGLYLSNFNMNSKNLKVFNNMISINSGAAAIYALALEDTEIMHNTLNVYGEEDRSSTLIIDKDTKNVDIQNNIIYNTASGVACEYLNIGKVSANNNLIYTNGEALIKSPLGDFRSIAEWTTASKFDKFSMFFETEFIDENNLHSNSLKLKFGESIEGYTTDIDGEERSTPFVSVGADDIKAEESKVEYRLNAINSPLNTIIKNGDYIGKDKAIEIEKSSICVTIDNKNNTSSINVSTVSIGDLTNAGTPTLKIDGGKSNFFGFMPKSFDKEQTARLIFYEDKCAPFIFDINVIVKTSEGISEQNKETIKVYPNPSNGIVNIQMPTDASYDNIVISDIQGKVIRCFSELSTNKNIKAELSQGLYIVKAISGNNVSIRKLIVK